MTNELRKRIIESAENLINNSPVAVVLNLIEKGYMDAAQSVVEMARDSLEAHKQTVLSLNEEPFEEGEE